MPIASSINPDHSLDITLHKYQMRAYASTKKVVAMIAGIQSGKGLCENETVLTPRGYIKIKDVMAGDILYDRNGKETTVTHVFKKGILPCYEIFFRDGRSIMVDVDHLHVIIDPHGRKERVLSTHHLLTSHRCYWDKKGNHAQIPSCEPIQFKYEELPVNPYLLGVLIGDGSFRYGIRFTTGDKETISEIKRIIPSDLEINHVNKYDWRIKSVKRLTDKKGYMVKSSLEKSLDHLGLNKKLSHEKYIPNIYKFSSIEQRLEILRGLMDTDGYVKKNKEITFYSTSKQLAKDVQFIVESLGGLAEIRSKLSSYKKNGIRKICKTIYMVNIVLKNYNPFRLERKSKEYFIHKHAANKVIDRIEYLGNHKSVCISVDSPTKTFIAKNQVVTHNTTLGALWLAKKAAEFDAPGNHFIVCAPTAKIREQSSLPWLLKVFKGCGEYMIGAEEFRLNGGGRIYCRSVDDPNAIEGITNVKAIWCDEAGMYHSRAWAAVLGRSAFSQCQIMITTTPYSLNWLYRDVYLPWRDKKIDDYDVIQFKSIDNPHFPPAEIELQRRILDPRMFRMKYEGTFERMAGLVFAEPPHMIEKHKINHEIYNIYCGVDIGFSDPFVLEVVAVHKEGRDIISFGEFYRSQMPLSDRINVMKQYKDIFRIKQFFVDSAHPTDIDAMNTAGLPVVAVEKGKDSIQAGISIMTELIKEEKWKIMDGTCLNLQKELNQYSYPEDPGDGTSNDKPIDAYNHCVVEGTMIETLEGEKPIESVRYGDMVLTSNGYKKVLWSGITGVKKVGYIKSFNNEIRCTPKHKIYTANRGFIDACLLTPQDILCILDKNGGNTCKLNFVSGMDSNFTDTQNQGEEQIENILAEVKRDYMLKYGSKPWAVFPRDSMYTTLTEIVKITEWKTCVSKRKGCTLVNIAKNGMKKIKNNAKSIFQKLDLSQKYGTLQKKELIGIEIMLKTARVCMSILTRSVLFVVKATKSYIFLKARQDFAQTIVSRNIVGKLALTMLSVFVKAAETLIKSINIQKQNHVQENVLGLSVDPKKVYNLHVEGCHEFFANGILVHNCVDATRYSLISVYNKYKSSQPRQPVVMTKLQRVIRGDFNVKEAGIVEDGLGEPIKKEALKVRHIGNVQQIEEDYWN